MGECDKGGIMKNFLVLLVVAGLFVACDYGSESLELKPDVEVVWINPLGAGTYIGDTLPYAEIEEIHFVAENSVDCYLQKMVYEYYDADSNLFYGPTSMALYAKVEGRTDPYCVDTCIILGVPIPLTPIRSTIPSGQAAQVLLHFHFVDEYWGDKYDTVTVWFGVLMLPL